MSFCRPQEGVHFHRRGKWLTNTVGGRLYRSGDRVVVNSSGGLESKGHPIGATGLAQCHELVTQLRHEAGIRQVVKCRENNRRAFILQVPNCKRALQHNFGIGGAAVVTLYEAPSARAQL